MLRIDLTDLPPTLHLGTSSFSWEDWRGLIYPPHAHAHTFLRHYARIFPTVEIDATWHAMPSPRTVESWASRVPPGFTFSLKVPKEITHERALLGCEDLWRRFLRAIEPFGDKLGALLLQFPYVAKGKDPDEYVTGNDFRRRLEAFLPHVPEGIRCAVEVRNAPWYRGPLPDLLRRSGICLALVSYYTMPSPKSLGRLDDLITAPFSYVRFLGNHKEMDELVRQERQHRPKERDWDELLVDRTAVMAEWAPILMELARRQEDVFVYVNNHFAGCAPASVAAFAKMLRAPVDSSRGVFPPTATDPAPPR